MRRSVSLIKLESTSWIDFLVKLWTDEDVATLREFGERLLNHFLRINRCCWTA